MDESLTSKVRVLYNKAQGNYVYEKDIEDKALEAFLVQSILLEGVLKNLIELEIKKSALPGGLKDKKLKQGVYGLNEIINDLAFVGALSDEQFLLLEKYRKARNKLVHNLLSGSISNESRKARKLYKDIDPLLWGLVSKL